MGGKGGGVAWSLSGGCRVFGDTAKVQGGMTMWSSPAGRDRGGEEMARSNFGGQGGQCKERVACQEHLQQARHRARDMSESDIWPRTRTPDDPLSERAATVAKDAATSLNKAQGGLGKFDVEKKKGQRVWWCRTKCTDLTVDPKTISEQRREADCCSSVVPTQKVRRGHNGHMVIYRHSPRKSEQIKL